MATHAFGLENRESGFGSSELHSRPGGLLRLEQTHGCCESHSRYEAKIHFHGESFTIPQHIERCMQPARRF
jgi:hypothetical protein